MEATNENDSSFLWQLYSFGKLFETIDILCKIMGSKIDLPVEDATLNRMSMEMIHLS